MTIDFISLIFIWLLPLTARSTVTYGQNQKIINVMTGDVGNKFTHDQLTTQEVSSLNPLSEVSGRNIKQSITDDVNPTEETTTKTSLKLSLQTIPTIPSKTFLPNIQTAATPTSSIPSLLKSSTVGMKSKTEVQFKVTTSASREVTSQASNPTTTTRVPSMLRSSTQSQDTGKTLTSQFTSSKITHPSIRPTQSTNNISTTTPSTKHDVMQSTILYKSSLVSTKTPFIHINEATTRLKKDPPVKNAKSKNGAIHSKAVAGLIGGALIFMIVGFLVIYVKKRKLQRQQITTSDWAGPSPFLEGGADSSQVTLRSSNQISFSSFLPRRLSKRLSLLPETGEELEDMTPGTTFGDKHQESTFGREVNGNDVQESNGTAVVVPEMKSTGDALETVENSVSLSSSQTNDPLSTNNNSEVINLIEDHPANPPTPPQL